MMDDIATNAAANSSIHAVGALAMVNGVISAIGVVFLVIMFAKFASPQPASGLPYGRINDICVAIQYLLTIPIALVLYGILRPHHPTLIPIATVIGIIAMIAVVLLQLALVSGRLTFEQQVGWVTFAMIVGVGAWLIITGLVARSTGRLPRSVFMSAIAVPYLGYPVWAFWLGWQLLNW